MAHSSGYCVIIPFIVYLSMIPTWSYKLYLIFSVVQYSPSILPVLAICREGADRRCYTSPCARNGVFMAPIRMNQNLLSHV